MTVLRIAIAYIYIEKKKADGARIHVSVIDGYFAALREVGVPASVCLQLQESKLHLRQAQWTARQTTAGFSVCFFWPVPEAGANNGSPTQQASFKRKKRRRYKKKVPTASMTTVEIQKAELEPKKIAENTATPSNAHPLDEHVSTSAESDEQGESVDLLKCEEVNYETRNRAPGVRFRMPDGEEGWTPVVRKRSRSRRQDRMLIEAR